MKPVYGFRLFNISDGKLRPIGMPRAPHWNSGKNTASCLCQLEFWSKTNVADSGHRCGFWACPTLEQAFSQSSSAVAAAVVGWGRVTIHKFGWRAQHARILALGHARCLGMRELASAYGVPYVAVDDLPIIAREHGQDMSEIPEEATVSIPDPQPSPAYTLAVPPGTAYTLGAYFTFDNGRSYTISSPSTYSRNPHHSYYHFTPYSQVEPNKP